LNKKFNILKIDHIAVAVNNIQESINIFDLLGMKSKNVEHVKNEKVNVIKLHPDSIDHTIELLESADSSSTIQKFLDIKGQGLHHIALEVDDIYNAIKYLEYNNVKMIYSEPRIGSDKKMITFIHPSSTPGILIEICQTS
tara:strand:+ start:6319 stop:6738 length:420 start_codon:yes stop_codon:yes gene_type:complete